MSLATNEELITFDSEIVDNSENLTCQDVGYSNETIYFQNGQYLIPADNDTFIFQSSNLDNSNHYILDYEANVVNSEDDSLYLSTSDLVRYYDEETGLIYFCTNTENSNTQYISVENVELSNKSTVDEPEIVATTTNIDKIVEIDDSIDKIEDAQSNYSFVVLKDGKLHLQPIQSTESVINSLVDQAKIIQRSSLLPEELKGVQKPKNYSTGNLANGRRKLRGKIVKIQRKSENLTMKKNHSKKGNGKVGVESSKISKCHFYENKHISKEDFQKKVSSILIGLMEVHGIKQQLIEKKIIIKLVDKEYDCNTASYRKTLCYAYGHMIKLTVDCTEKWGFVVDSDGTECSEACSNLIQQTQTEGSQTLATYLHLLTTVGKNGRKTTRVMIEEKAFTHCPLCFKTGNDIVESKTEVNVCCDFCGVSFSDIALLKKHSWMHYSQRFECSTCGRQFSTHSNWLRHLEIHKLTKGVVHTCDVCGCCFNYASSLTRHVVQTHIKNS